VRRTWRGAALDELWALKNISLTVHPGEIFGVLGANGSGKSTLLRLIAGVMEPTTGHVEVTGRVGALLDLAAGFHPELTGIENIELNGALLGMSPREVKSKREDIIAFSGLEEFVDTAVKYYSSGMLMRLGFSIAIHLDPDVVLVDEVLAVGDEAFQRKCLERIDLLKTRGKSIVLVTHDMEQVKQMCDSAAWLEKGELLCSGEPDSVVGRYLEFADMTDQPVISPEVPARWGTREVEISRVSLHDGDGQERSVYQTGEPWIVRICYHSAKVVHEPVFGIAIHSAEGIHVTGPNTKSGRMKIPALHGSGTIEYVVETLPLLPGSYELSVAVYDRLVRQPYDHHDRLYPFRVGKGKTLERHGMVSFRGTWRHESESN
jgi:ABC-type polysaccharide/polyol phosphate transport system ATPase subunit